MARGLGRGQGAEGKAKSDLAGPFGRGFWTLVEWGFYSKPNEDARLLSGRMATVGRMARSEEDGGRACGHGTPRELKGDFLALFYSPGHSLTEHK